MKTTQRKRKNGYTCERKNGKVVLPLHWFFVSDSIIIKTYLVTYDGKANFQILMHCLDMLAICFKKQMLTSRIKVWYPPHLDVLMFEL
jgi:hypothetical protein